LPIKNLTLGVCLLLAGHALAQDRTYTVQQGDTLTKIAAKFDVRQQAILEANNLDSPNRLKIGLVLRIPNATVYTARRDSAAVSGVYEVRNGDQEWSISRKFGITPAQLRAMNPNVRWTPLAVGTKLNVPRTAESVTQARQQAGTASLPERGTGAYTVQPGDNDWIIARRFSTTAAEIRRLNPDVRWDRLQIGLQIRVPGGGAVATNVAAAPAPAPAPAATPAPAAQAPRFAVVQRNNTVIRQAPTANSRAVRTTAAGTSATILERRNDWFRVRFGGGTEGWLPSHAIALTANAPAPAAPRVASAAPAATSATAQSIIAKAETFRGVRYRYGAMSRSGTDCSGFTVQVFAAHGIKLPRTSASQAGVGVAVPRNNLAAGDLVFFQTIRGRRISHVGIYIGNGKFIHASSGGGRVQVDSLSSGYYNNRFVTARRVAKLSASVFHEIEKAFEEDPDDVIPSQTF
jgi:cell wall-associated NlpC family hydrolase